MSLEIRAFQPADLPALYRICVQTGEAGDDASSLYSDPKLLGHFYAAPYAIHDPALCLIATWKGEPAGYILGADDSAGFRAWTEAKWFPALREHYASPAASDMSAQAELIRLLHAGYRNPEGTEAYPAHLHIDLLPILQGKGVGRQLMLCFFALLRQRGCAGVHLGVSEANARAIAFYEKIGFSLLGRHPGWRAYGYKL